MPDERPWEEFELLKIPPGRWGPKRFLKECTAVDADSGRKCTRLEHAGTVHNASGRPFTAVLGAGQVPTREIDEYATTQRESAIPVRGPSETAGKSAARERYRNKLKNPPAPEVP